MPSCLRSGVGMQSGRSASCGTDVERPDDVTTVHRRHEQNAVVVTKQDCVSRVGAADTRYAIIDDVRGNSMAAIAHSRPRMSAHRRREARAGLLFILPWLVSLLVFTAYPVLASLFLSLTDYTIIEPPR